MNVWEPVDEAGRMRRWEYKIGTARANAVAIDLGGGELVLLSPPGGDGGEAALVELDRLGKVTAIVAPNAFHRSGIPIAEAHYPAATIHVDPRGRDRIVRVCGDASRVRPLVELVARLPAEIDIFVPPHLKRPDTIARVTGSDGVAWYINDLVVNIERLPPGWFSQAFFRMLGFRPGLMFNPFGGRRFLVGDRKAFSQWMCEELAKVPPKVLVTGHGPVVRDAALLGSLPELVVRGLA